MKNWFCKIVSPMDIALEVCSLRTLLSQEIPNIIPFYEAGGHAGKEIRILPLQKNFLYWLIRPQDVFGPNLKMLWDLIPINHVIWSQGTVRHDPGYHEMWHRIQWALAQNIKWSGSKILWHLSLDTKVPRHCETSPYDTRWSGPKIRGLALR